MAEGEPKPYSVQTEVKSVQPSNGLVRYAPMTNGNGALPQEVVIRSNDVATLDSQVQELDELKVHSMVDGIIKPDGTVEILDSTRLKFIQDQKPVIKWYELVDGSGRKYFSHPDFFVESDDGSGDQELVRLYPDAPEDFAILIDQGVEL